MMVHIFVHIVLKNTIKANIDLTFVRYYIIIYINISYVIIIYI